MILKVRYIEAFENMQSRFEILETYESLEQTGLKESDFLSEYGKIWRPYVETKGVIGYYGYESELYILIDEVIKTLEKSGKKFNRPWIDQRYHSISYEKFIMSECCRSYIKSLNRNKSIEDITQ